MRNIRIEYRNVFRYKIIEMKMPECLDELTEEQFITAVKYYLGQLSDSQFISEFLSIPHKIIRRLHPYSIFKLTELADFIRHPDGKTARFLIQKPCQDAVAPLDGLRNMTFKQYMLCDTLFSAYSIHRNKVSLDELFNSLYFYNKENKSPADEPTKLAVYFNWLFIRNYLSSRFPFVFPENSDKDKEPKQEQKVVEWLPVFDAFVGDDIAHIYDYEKLLVMDVLRIMNTRIKKHQPEKFKNSKR